MKTREEAWSLLNEHVKNAGLIKHCLAVESAMRKYAGIFGGDEEEWAIAGLLHDFDYEEFPTPDPVAKTGHPFEGVKMLRAQGYPDGVCEAILGHATYATTPRTSQMAKCLFACDELCGFILAMGYVRPERLSGMTAESVKKGLKKKKFAEKVSRQEIASGMAEIGLAEDEHIQNCIAGVQTIADQLFPSHTS